MESGGIGDVAVVGVAGDDFGGAGFGELGLIQVTLGMAGLGAERNRNLPGALS